MRAVRHDRDTAVAMGIPAKRVYVLTFGIGFALAAFGGAVAAPITTVDFRGGVDVLPFCFMAVIIGGLGNLPGTVAAAVLLSFLEGHHSERRRSDDGADLVAGADERSAAAAAAGPVQGFASNDGARALEIGLATAGAAFLIAVPWLIPALIDNFWVSVITEILIWSLFAASVNLLFGYVGLLSFGQALYFGFGMYGVALRDRSFRPVVLAGVWARDRLGDGDGAGLGHLRGPPELALFRDHHRGVLADLLFPRGFDETADRRRRRNQFHAAADLQFRRQGVQPDRSHLPVLLRSGGGLALFLPDAPGDQ